MSHAEWGVSHVESHEGEPGGFERESPGKPVRGFLRGDIEKAVLIVSENNIPRPTGEGMGRGVGVCYPIADLGATTKNLSKGTKDWGV